MNSSLLNMSYSGRLTVYIEGLGESEVNFSGQVKTNRTLFDYLARAYRNLTGRAGLDFSESKPADWLVERFCEYYGILVVRRELPQSGLTGLNPVNNQLSLF